MAIFQVFRNKVNNRYEHFLHYTHWLEYAHLKSFQSQFSSQIQSLIDLMTRMNNITKRIHTNSNSALGEIFIMNYSL